MKSADRSQGHASDPIIGLGAWSYERGCQEKTSPSQGLGAFLEFRDIQPSLG